MFKQILQTAQKNERHVANFLRDIIAIKSLSSQEEEVIHRIKEEMERCNYDEITIDPIGNILGRIGKGKHIIALDAHVDTVDVGNPANWTIDPFKGAEKDGIIYGRGACDMKGAFASILYGGKIIKELGLEDDFTLYVEGACRKKIATDCAGNILSSKINCGRKLSWLPSRQILLCIAVIAEEWKLKCAQKEYRVTVLRPNVV